MPCLNNVTVLKIKKLYLFFSEQVTVLKCRKSIRVGDILNKLLEKKRR